MFSSVLIANRGEIAVRIAATCRRLGIRVIAVYSEADSSAMHVQAADEAYFIGRSEARASYLNGDAILAVAKRSGAEAIHPGYGFLSENADFAESVQAAGLAWIGPPAESIRAMGDKASAKHYAVAGGVPVVPGYDGDDQTDATLVAEASKVGLPLLIKATAGGGGRGMREVHGVDDFVELLESARREASSAFGDDRVILERLITRARHVEIQIIGDGHGAMLHLGERDCSVQRRHQKVLEESPSPAVDAALRSAMGEAAVKAALSVGYRNAGTVEFLLSPDHSYYFLEMNTRLQVEHPVTELVTGLDLVELQLRVAAGEPLPLTQQDVRLQGHAIEARLYAEDPAQDFLPGIGRISELIIPSGPNIRVDAGYQSGSEVSPFYDSMLAKVIAYGDDRPSALRQLNKSLNETVVAGVPTNLRLLREILRTPEFAAGNATTDFLDPWVSENATSLSRPPEDAIAAAAGFVLQGGLPPPSDPGAWSVTDAWRLGPVTRRLAFLIDGLECTVYAKPLSDGRVWEIKTGDLVRNISFERVDESQIRMLTPTASVVVGLETVGGLYLRLPNGERLSLSLAGLPAPDTGGAGAGSAGAGNEVRSPLPGVLRKVYVAEGQTFKTHEILAVLEAMKMEHALRAPADGSVKQLLVAEGTQVVRNQVVMELDL